MAIALARPLPEGPEKAPILAIIFGVVVCSVLVQGLTFKRVVNRVLRPEEES